VLLQLLMQRRWWRGQRERYPRRWREQREPEVVSMASEHAAKVAAAAPEMVSTTPCSEATAVVSEAVAVAAAAPALRRGHRRVRR